MLVDEKAGFDDSTPQNVMDVADGNWAEAMHNKDKHAGAGCWVHPDGYLEENGSWWTAAWVKPCGAIKADAGKAAASTEWPPYEGGAKRAMERGWSIPHPPPRSDHSTIFPQAAAQHDGVDRVDRAGTAMPHGHGQGDADGGGGRPRQVLH